MQIYVASSWRNSYHAGVVKWLRYWFDVYDFRNNTAFHWSDIDENWLNWSTEEYIINLSDSLAKRGFDAEFKAMQSCDACILILPCGRSAHLEAGYFVGVGKPLIVFLPERIEPELMYKMAHAIVWDYTELLRVLYKLERKGDIK